MNMRKVWPLKGVSNQLISLASREYFNLHKKIFSVVAIEGFQSINFPRE